MPAAHGSSGTDGVLFALFVLLAVAALAAYGLAAARDRRWSGWLTASFALGIALVVAAMSPAVAGWAHADLRGHMVQHLLLGMYAPIALVLAAPMTLLLRTVPASAGRRVVRWLGTPPARFLVHPATAAVLDVGGMYLLYLTPLYALTLVTPSVHVWVHLHFVLSGCLFTWALIGPDPAPRRPGLPTRLVVLGLAMAAHAVLAKVMYGYGFPRGPQVAGSTEAAALLMYYGGDLAELALAGVLFAAWFRARRTRPGAAAAFPRRDRARRDGASAEAFLE